MAVQFNLQSFKTNLSWERIKNINFFLVFLVAALVGGLIYAVPKVPQPKTTPKPTETPTLPTIPPPPKISSPSTTTIVYGVWRGGKAEIQAINADGTNDSAIAFLSTNVKDVHVLSKDQLLYIAETDKRDHGTKIEIYNLTDGTTQTVAQAEPGWGIDDIIISPDKTWFALWEVKFAPGKDILLGGNSRVYTQQLSGFGSKNLIVNEVASPAVPIRYPLFFDGQNRLYLDGFIPNGGGWNLGLWVVNPNGSNLNPVLGMSDSEFSSDPTVSPDGDFITFTGYDPNAPIQTAAQDTGIARPAILNPNLLQTLNLNTGQKTTLLPSSGGAQYGFPIWSDDGTKIAFLKYKLSSPVNSSFESVKIFDLSTSTTISIADVSDADAYLLKLSGNKFFWGLADSEPGNLGESYNPLLSSIFVFDLETSENKVLKESIALQFIDAVDKNPASELGMTISPKAVQEEVSPTVKLKSFEVKPIAQVRGPQQNNDEDKGIRCRDLLGRERKKEWAAAKKANKCYDSPLYLYPEKDTWVKIKVAPKTEILASCPEYRNGWQVFAKNSGELISDKGETFDKINYAFSAPKFSPPNSGLIVEKVKLKDVLCKYASKLGLIEGEVKDFVAFWQENLPSANYYFVSHFDKKTAAEVMSFEIAPKPDTFIQAVMYFKPLQSLTNVEPPFFEPVPERKGFVAVDWSGIIDD